MHNRIITGESVYYFHSLAGTDQPDRLDVPLVTVFRRRGRIRAADADADLEAVGHFACEYYGLLQPGPGAAKRWLVLAWGSGCLRLQLVLRLPHSSNTAGGISPDLALLQAARAEAG
ncbi:hypothetical protein D3C75_985320 [compost metagenome]